MTPVGAVVLATVVVLIVRVPLRMLGRWLQRKGRDLERNRRSPSDDQEERAPDPFELP